MTHRKIDSRREKSWPFRLKGFFTGKRSRAVRIDLYATCWNEERMIPFFLRHYEPLVDRIVIFDDGSTDRSRELLAASSKVELRGLVEGGSYILRHVETMNHCWKESRGRTDWVIVADIDEHIYHHRALRDYLEQCKAAGKTILKPLGVDMVSDTFPPANTVLCETVRRGIRSFLLDKLGVFNPEAIDEINYTPGRHVAQPSGRVVFPEKREVKLLHFKQMGLEYMLRRSKELGSRKTDIDRERGWAAHDQRSIEHIRADFEKMQRAAEDISLIGKRPSSLQSGRDQRRL